MNEWIAIKDFYLLYWRFWVLCCWIANFREIEGFRSYIFSYLPVIGQFSFDSNQFYIAFL